MNTKSLLFSTLAAILSASGAVHAADFEIGGLLGQGLVYTHSKVETPSGSHTDSSLAMRDSFAPYSFVEMRGTEDLGSGYSVGFSLETRFKSDSGALMPDPAGGSKMFGGQSLLILKGPLGEISFGRAGTLLAGMGRYDVFLNTADIMNGGYADDIGTAGWLERDRADNMITLVSAPVSNFTFYGQYSHGMGNDGVSDRDKTRYAAVGLKYRTADAAFVVVADRVMKPNHFALETKDAASVSVGGQYRLQNGITLYAATQFGWNENRLQWNYLDEEFAADAYAGQFDGSASALGANIPWQLGNLGISVTYAEGDGTASFCSGGTVTEKRFGLRQAGIHFMNYYNFSKRTTLYTGAGFKKKEVGDVETTVVQAGIGLMHGF